MTVDAKTIQTVAQATRAHTFRTLTMDEHTDLVRDALAAYLSARSAEPVADAYYEAWKENSERKVRFAYAHPTPEPTP